MQERLQLVIDRLMRGVREAVEELGITEEELTAAVRFFNEVGRTGQFQILSDVMKLSVLVNDQTYRRNGATTVPSVEGPFYRPGAPRYRSPARLGRPNEPGDRLVVSGRVVDARTREPLAGAILDIWQAGANGKYDHEDPNQPEWNLRGVLPAEADGSFEFQTILPHAYPVPDGPVTDLLRRLGRHNLRPGHIHVKLRHPGYEPVTTMLFFEGDPYLADDVIGAVREELIVHPVRIDDPAATAARGLDRPFYTFSYEFALQPERWAPAAGSREPRQSAVGNRQ